MARKAPTVRNPEDRFQRDTREAVKSINSSPILGGVLVKDVALTTNTARVYHNLGRPAIGFFVVDATEDVTVWRDSTNVVTPSSVIPLRASTSATVSLWIF